MKLIVLLAAFTVASSRAATLSSPSLTAGEFSFLFDSSPDQLYTVQATDSLVGNWSNLESRRGTGDSIRFATAAGATQRFFRISATGFQEFAFEPGSPMLGSGAISLPDATVGAAYLQMISTAQKGIPPYTLQLSGALPNGLSATLLSNGTANAAIQIATKTAALIAGQRLQFTISGTDAAGTNISQKFDIRVIEPAPEILTTLVTMKSGQSPNASMNARGGTGALNWEIISGPRPAGVLLSSAGVFVGAPSADDAEFQLTGRFINEVKVTDSLTDRVTGAPAPRSATNVVVQFIKLTYSQNIFSETNLGPRFGSICVGCHGSSFLPNFNGEATEIINMSSRSDLSCPDATYIVPGNPFASLIYRKITNPDCGVRMPRDGPYLPDSAIELVRRWIEELDPNDID